MAEGPSAIDADQADLHKLEVSEDFCFLEVDCKYLIAFNIILPVLCQLPLHLIAGRHKQYLTHFITLDDHGFARAFGDDSMM